MFKVNCQIGTKQQPFFLDGVQPEEVAHIAAVLTNNLAFEDTQLKPEVVSIEEIEQAEGSVFRYLGVEKFTGEAIELSRYREELLSQNILPCAVHNWRNNKQNSFTEIYKFTT